MVDESVYISFIPIGDFGELASNKINRWQAETLPCSHGPVSLYSFGVNGEK
jgi:hypothetical protein